MKKKIYSLLLLTGMLISTCACAIKATPSITIIPTELPPQKAEITIIPTPEATLEPTPESTPEPTLEPTPELTKAPIVKNIISPFPSDIDITHLDNCSIAVSFNKGDIYIDDAGIMQIDVTVYTYDIYDIVSIFLLEEGDTILLRGKETEISSLVRTEHGSVVINGGLDAGGYELISDDSTVFFETGYSDQKAYYEVGKATLRISADFLFTDAFDLDKGEITYYPGDFLTDDAGILYYFTPHNTSIVIENGQVIAMKRIYTP